jgi:hypothetical protein
MSLLFDKIKLYSDEIQLSVMLLIFINLVILIYTKPRTGSQNAILILSFMFFMFYGFPFIIMYVMRNINIYS